MKFEQGIYVLHVDQDSEGYDLNLYKSEKQDNPLLYLKLSPLSEVNCEFDNKLQARDIPRKLFKVGDFYQSSANKYDKSIALQKVSLLSIVHDILLENRKELPDLKRIFSSSLNKYKEETFITDQAIHFWNVQLNKKPNMPISYFKDDKRYLLVLNE